MELASAGAAATGGLTTTGDVLISGVLKKMKQGKKWKQRWCAILDGADGPRLLYRESEKAKKAKEAIAGRSVADPEGEGRQSYSGGTSSGAGSLVFDAANPMHARNPVAAETTIAQTKDAGTALPTRVLGKEKAAAAHQLYGEAPPAATGVSQPRLPKTLSMKDAVSAHL